MRGHGHGHEPDHDPASARPGPARPDQAVRDGQGEERVGGQKEARCRIADGEQIGRGQRRTDHRRHHQFRAVEAGADSGAHTPRHEQRQRKEPQGSGGIPPGHVAGAAQQAPAEGAHVVVDGEVPAEPALDLAGPVQPGGETAVRDIRLDDPFGAPDGQARGERDQQEPSPTGPHHHGCDRERQGEPHRIRGAHQRGERHAGGQTGGRPPVPRVPGGP
ncbi:hypothetical protein [Streptomyces sp. NPDC051211]|uniref:hypothetical protein n=1 Tax=Streptomyces sp. NPDC051211 TaxID=3154643 RepID=UPI00344F400A